MSYRNRLCVKIGDTMDDINGTKTQIRRRHLQEAQYLRDSFQGTVRKKKQWKELTSGPFRHPAENKGFCPLNSENAFL